MNGVSILILLEVLLQLSIRRKKRYRKYVSILILLEVLLQHNKGALLWIQKDCFNPYFTGSSTSTA